MTALLEQPRARLGSEPTQDALLQMSRRLDWRFLLPCPELGRVALAGVPDESLVEPLRHFCSSLDVITDVTPLEEKQPHADEQYDLLVVCNPDRPTLKQAVAMVRPGGFLYVEVDRRIARHGRKGAGSCRAGRPDHDMRLLEAWGLQEAAAYWHWPDFQTCTRIVPLGERSALRSVVARRGGGLGKWCRAVVGRCLVSCGGLTLAVRCFSLVAQQPARRSATGG